MRDCYYTMMILTIQYTYGYLTSQTIQSLGQISVDLLMCYTAKYMHALQKSRVCRYHFGCLRAWLLSMCRRSYPSQILSKHDSRFIFMWCLFVLRMLIFFIWVHGSHLFCVFLIFCIVGSFVHVCS